MPGRLASGVQGVCPFVQGVDVGASRELAAHPVNVQISYCFWIGQRRRPSESESDIRGGDWWQTAQTAPEARDSK